MSETIVHEFETISRAEIFDALCDAYDRAKALAVGDARWSSALNTAWAWLLEQDEISYDLAHWAIRVQSATHPSRIYVSNGACGCEAFQHERPCWHRAAARLVRRAVEGTLAEVAAEWDEAAQMARSALVQALAEAEIDELFPPRLAA
jgi:hypothetical protein